MPWPDDQHQIDMQQLPPAGKKRNRAPYVPLSDWPPAEIAQASTTGSTRLLMRSRARINTGSIATKMDADCPVTWAETPSGLLVFANGINPVRFWDGLSFQSVELGVPAPTTAISLQVAPGGSLAGTYTAFQRWLDKDGNPSNLSPVSNSVTFSGGATIIYDQVQAPTDLRVTRRQILRNTDGQADTYYVDIDTTDLGSTQFTSTKTDAQLSNVTVDLQVALFDVEGDSLANRFGVPPSHKRSVVHHNDRMFLAVECPYKRGHVEATHGSATIQGIGTNWPSTFVGRKINIVGADRTYEITAVDTTLQQVTISQPYASATDKFLPYTIRAAPAERRLVYFSGAGMPHAWKATDAISLQEDGDELTGMFVMGTFIYLVERRHIYRFTFKNDPLVDGYAFLSAHRGALSQRVVVVVDDTAYMMDDRGIHAFLNDERSEPISSPINDMFRPGGSGLKVNLTGKDLFHAAHFPSQEVIRWFVTLEGTRFPRHALCYSYVRRHWWIEEYPHRVTASCVATLEVPRTLVGTERTSVSVLESDTLDYTDADQGTVRGQVDSATPFTIVDNQASFASSGLVGAPLAIVSGRGKGQVNTITAVSSFTIHLKYAWQELPSSSGDDQSTYQIGGIPWRWKSGNLRWLEDEMEVVRGVELIFEPKTTEGSFDVLMFEDNARDPNIMGETRETDGVKTIRGEPETVIDETIERGYARMRRSDSSEVNVQDSETVTVELAGFSNEERTVVNSVRIEGAR